MNLHYFITFSSRGSGVYRSLFLRTFMVMMLFITGSNGIYAGEDLKATIEAPASNGTWNPSNGTYNWTLGYDNLMPIFRITQGTLKTDYVALKFTTSNYTSKYRVCFMNGTTAVATVTFDSAGEKTIKISELIPEKGKDLSQVDNIQFGGGLYISSGSITLDPNSIVLVGQLQNNTQRYDLSTFKVTNQGGNVQSAAYDTTEKALKVITQGPNNNYFPLYKDLNGTKRTGVRLHAKGVKFRIVAKTSDDKTFQVNVPANDDYVTRHYKWEDFVQQFSTTKMTEADVANITEIGLAGDNADGETNKVFYVKEFWLDDIADYDNTIPCYGDEGGQWDGGKNSFVYTTAGATAVFEGSTTRDANHNIILNPNNKVTLSSDVNKFTEVCLVFGAKTPETKTTYDLIVADKQYTGTSTAVICPVNSSELTIKNNSSSAIFLSKIIYSSEKVGINEERTITVDGKTRKYWIYAPGSVNGKTNVPVIFSLHGRQDKGADPDKTDAPKFKDIADTKGVIIVYPQGRHATDTGYPNRTENGKEVAWNSGYAGNNYGWEATGQENADTKFIQALVDELKKNNFYGSTKVDPTRFYLCGFSMGGMMTYACAKVLNGTFAAYGSCGGYPLNEFHLNLATKQPVPFIHLHGNSDNFVGINRLHTIIENLLFRNGCNLANYKVQGDLERDGFKRYDFTGENNVPVTTVTFKDLYHSVAPSAPDYLWNFFKDKKLGTYTTTTMKWQWDMPTINGNLGNENGNHYGWERIQIAGGKNGTLTYGDNRKNNVNQNVYNSIQLEKGTYKLHAQATVVKSDNTGIIVGIYKVGATENNGTCIVRRQVKNNSGNASDNLSILYPFTVTEDGEYYVKIERGNAESSCTALAIHTSDYNPDDEDDSENAMNLPTDWKNTGLIVKIDFEESNVGANCGKINEETTYIKEGKDQNNNDYIHFTGTVPNEGYKLYNCHKGDNKQNWEIKDVILHDEVFGNYFQNIPKAQFYDRSAKQNYMRAVLPKGALSPIKTSGEATIGFWVNGRVAVDAGLSYFDASMLYLSGPNYSAHHAPTEDNGTEASDKQYQSMFNIRCNGNTNGFLKNATSNQVRYYADDMFGDYCDHSGEAGFYKKNLYLDRNWHYVTMVMYNDLRNVDMYVDGELTNSRKNIVGSDQDLKAGLDSINHIIIGGLNATYTTFGYDPAFAFDDIVIYSRALSSQEINQIISDKKYSPNSWDFEKDIANSALLNEEKLNATGSLWTYNSDTQVYTLKKKLSNEAELTYDGIRVIPAFRGLKFVTGAEGQIQIDMANKRLKVTGVAKATVMTISNAPADQYLRYEFDNKDNVWLDDWSNQDFQGDIWISDSKTVITNVSGSGRQTCTCNVNGTISFKSIGSTDKVYADLCFGTSTGKTDINRVSKVDFSSEALKNVNVTEYTGYPQLLLIENGTNYGNQINFQDLKDSKYSGKIKFWSSAPHVAYITGVTDNQPTVKATGVPGSAYIYAELQNDNEYDCNNENAGLYEFSSRIIARYEIHVPNKETGYSVKISNDKNHDNNPFNVGDVLKTTDNAVTLTLGGWKYNSGEYFKKTDGYTKKEQWKGMPLNKTENDTKGYSSEYDTSSGAATTDGDTYSALSSYTGGTHAASSEQMNGEANTGLFSTTVINNRTAWTLPCRGSYAKIEPTEAGIISVYVLQEGCMERNLTGVKKTFFNGYPEIAPNEPYDISIKKVYVADEAGQVIEDVVTDTKSKIVSQVWKDDGRARAEYSYYVENTAYSQLLYERFKQNIVDVTGDNYAVTLLDKWNSPGMTQNIIKFGKGFGIVDKGIVRYTFNVLPGKTYYIFSNDAKMGIAGFNFTKDKQLNFNSKHEIIANNPLAGDLTPTESVTLDDGKDYDYTLYTEKKNANVKLNRTFYTNYWNAICLPYSINRRQIEDVFGDGTMVVLMNYIDTSNKKVMFIEHANQDIIAGYPYLIFPTKKTDNDKTNHDPITGIITRATFGEADSPLFSVGTNGNTYPGAEMQPNALVFKGTFSKANLPVGSYVITKSGTLANVSQTGLWINPYRAYIHFNQTTLGAKAIKLASMGFAGINDMEGETTSIEDLLFNDGIMTRPADVFNVNGQKVRSKAENLYGLPKGVYIVNGKKYVNK